MTSKKTKKKQSTAKKEAQQNTIEENTTEDGQGGIIEEIKIEKKNLPIDTGFTLEELKELNVIVGKNNSGKTKCFKSIEEKYKNDTDWRVVYIPANEVKPEDDYYKSGVTTTLVKILSALFGGSISLSNHKGVTKKIKGFFQNVNEKFTEMCNNEDGCGVQIDLKSDLNKGEIIKSMIESITTNLKDENKKPIKMSDIGQGYQRMFIAALLQVYAEKEISGNRKILILFEEPELFLHPEMKRNLNKSLKKIASKENHQVIISTHDPYFLWSNMDDEDTQTYSFKTNKDGKTEVGREKEVGFGVEDEMLHISLFSKMIELMEQQSMKHGLGSKKGDTMEDTSNFLANHCSGHNFTPKTYQYNNKSYAVILPIYIRNKIHHPENQSPDYTPEEMTKSIRDLNYILTKL